MIGNNYIIVLTILPYNSRDDCVTNVTLSHETVTKRHKMRLLAHKWHVTNITKCHKMHCFTWGPHFSLEQVSNLHATFLAVDLTCW